jgi:hypothetical protein
MKLPQPPTRRGQPLTALAMLLLLWVSARTALWAASPLEADQLVMTAKPASASPVKAGGPVVQTAAEPATSSQIPAPTDSPIRPIPAPVTSVPIEPVPEPSTRAPEPLPPRIAAGHQLLFIAGVSALPMPEEARAAATIVDPVQSPPVPYLPTARAESLRWSADGWILWRQGGNGFNLPGAGLPGASLPSGAYGSSQAGMVLRYRLAPDSPLRPTLFLRASSGLYRPRGEELAVGLALRPLPKLPVAVMGEARVTRTSSGDVVRPAVALVSEFPPVSLPLGLRGESYVQGGWVGGKDRTPFIDGQARIDKPVAKSGSAELRLGAGAWGGAQRGANRLDVGPTATLDLPVGPINTRLSADYRFRVAGDAAPGSGAAVTFSAGF